MRGIREKTLASFQEQGVLRPANNDITRHLMVWADHATLLNNGHLLLTVKSIYNPKIFFTDEEMANTFGKKVAYRYYLNNNYLVFFERLSIYEPNDHFPCTCDFYPINTQRISLCTILSSPHLLVREIGCSEV